jgi:TorA maturation chaperone TorD
LQKRSALAHWLSATLAGQYQPAAEGPDEIPDRSAQTESERVRLFVNAPGGISLPPYGSWWLDGALMGPSTVELAAFYSQEGLRSSEGSGPVDYLPAELEFMHFLLQHQVAAFLTHQDDLVTQCASREAEFLDRFLMPWVPKFCTRGREVTEDRFWLAVFDLLERFLEAERIRLI